MKFRETGLAGAWIVDLERHRDARGSFARVWCENEFRDHGLVSRVVQANTSFNEKAGTLRGMHYQAPPYRETKLVRCTRGALYDVIVDLRPDSPTYRSWTGVELTETNDRMLYVPADFAHGFITLEDATEVNYLVSETYMPGSERGVRWNDPAFAIEWPRPVTVISGKDESWPDFTA